MRIYVRVFGRYPRNGGPLQGSREFEQTICASWRQVQHMIMCHIAARHVSISAGTYGTTAHVIIEYGRRS